jgi:hypothetical protein
LGKPIISKDWDGSGTDQKSSENPTTSTTTERSSTVSVGPVGEDQAPVHPWERDVRLPKSVVPLHYDLYLFPDLNEGLFTGKDFLHLIIRRAFILLNFFIIFLSKKVFCNISKNQQTCNTKLFILLV